MRASLSLLLALGACAAPLDRAADGTSENNAGLTLDIEGETIEGVYNPDGFDDLEIKDLLKFNCPSQRLASYVERPGPRKLITFTATCAV